MAGASGCHWQFRKSPDEDRYGSLKAIQQPTLVVNGRHDLLVPTTNSYILQQHLSNATLIIYQDSGRGAKLQYPDLLVREAQFFRGWGRRYGDQLDVRRYREGILVIDVFDGRSHQPIWTGWATQELTQLDMEGSAGPIRTAAIAVLTAFPPK